ncbi:MAG: MFS transporter [Synergistaceae bacterium]|nr:MFS transporter [Synergistaceae bacterium]
MDSRLPREFFIAFATNMTAYVSIALFFLYPLALTLRGYSPFAVGLAWITFEVVLLAGRPWNQAFLARRGTRAGMTVGTLLMAGGIAILVGFPPLPLVLLGRGLQGLGWGLFSVANPLHLARVLPADVRGRGFGLSGLAPLLPQIFLIPPAEWLVLGGHHRVPLLTGLVCCLIALVLARSLREKGCSDLESPSFLDAFRTAWSRPDLKVLLLSGALFALGAAPVMPFIANAAREWGTAGSAFLLPSGLSALAVRFFLGHLVDRRGTKLLLPSFGALVGGIAVATWGASTAAFIVGGGLHGVGMGLTFPLLYSILSRRAPAEEYTALFTLYGTAVDLSWAVAPLFVSSLAGIFLYGPVLRAVAVGLALAVAIMELMLWKALRDGPEPDSASRQD